MVAPESKRGLGGGAPDAEAIFTVFFNLLRHWPGSQDIQYFHNTCCFALFIFRKLKLLTFYGRVAV